MKRLSALSVLSILIVSLFSSTILMIAPSNSVQKIYGVTSGNRTDSSTTAATNPELTAAAINSGISPSTDNFNLTSGYTIEPVLWNLTVPSSVEFDELGNMYIAEAGYGFGGLFPIPRILKVDLNGTVSLLADRFLNGPITDMVYHDGNLYVSNKAKISRVDPVTGLVTDLVVGLPAGGDHPNDQLVFGPDGRMYFAVGSATNSGVVGIDNYMLGWLSSFPMVHDVPAKNITLAGQNFNTTNMLADGQKNLSVVKDLIVKAKLSPQAANSSSGKGTADIAGNVTGNATTGAFVPYGNATSKGELIKGQVKCNACILSANPDGTDLKVVAWGMRLDIFSGLAFDKEGNLIITDSGSEERGSRPIRGDHDKIWKIDISDPNEIGKFYGWPDYFYNGSRPPALPSLQPVSNSSQFVSPRDVDGSLQPLLQNQSAPAADVFADPGYAVKPTKAALSNSSYFGFEGDIFFGEWGTHAPFTHHFEQPIKQYVSGNTNKTILGQKVAIVDPRSGNLTDFLSIKNPDPYFRPVDVGFGPGGNALYVVSLGKTQHVSQLPSGENLTVPEIWSYPNTGVIWRISKNLTGTESHGGIDSEIPFNQLKLSPDLSVAVNSGPIPKTDIFNLPSGYSIEPVAWNLNIPGSITFDDNKNMYIAEVGFAYNGLFPQPRILKVDHQTGNISVFIDRGLVKPVTDIQYHNGLIYIAHGGKISIADLHGLMKDIVAALPGLGDHFVGPIVFSPDGTQMFFSIGVATNGGVVGPDNPWAKALPTFHDIPGKNITLAGVNLGSEDFLSAAPNDNATTGAYVPFNTTTKKGQVIQGDVKCTGCILSSKLDGTDLKLIAWGLRHPYGMGFTDDGKLLVTMNGIDERGSRNVANDGDKIYLIDISKPENIGQFYGWPDFFGNAEPVTDPKFESPKNSQPLQFLIQKHPPVVKPGAVLDVGAGVTQLAIPHPINGKGLESANNSSDISNQNRSSNFGLDNNTSLIAEFGTLAPQTHLEAAGKLGPQLGTVMGQLIGQRIIEYNYKTGDWNDWLTINTADGSFRPTGLEFSPDGKSLYVASVALNEVRTVTPTGAVLPFPLGQPWAYTDTGILWKITYNG
ncbi:MAG TPA: hypothetical protein VE130_09810 [Nitrososphaeraceae archaeon]|nr:hypothetical protein [Nitrososphaeraceae archaeon]